MNLIAKKLAAATAATLITSGAYFATVDNVEAARGQNNQQTQNQGKNASNNNPGNNTTTTSNTTTSTNTNTPSTTVNSNVTGNGNCGGSGCTPEKPSGGGDGDTPGKCKFTASGVSFNANTITARYDSDIKGDNSYFVLKGKLRAPKDTSTIKSRILSKKLRDADAPFTSTIAQCIQTACEAEAANHNRQVGGNQITRAGGVNFYCHQTKVKSPKKQIKASNATPAKRGGVATKKKPYVPNTFTVMGKGCGYQNTVLKTMNVVKGTTPYNVKIGDKQSVKPNHIQPVNLYNQFDDAQVARIEACETFAVVNSQKEVCEYTEDAKATTIEAFAEGGECKAEATSTVSIAPAKPVEAAKAEIGCTYDFAEQGEQYRYNNSDEPITFNKGDVTEIVCGQATYYATSNGVSKIFLENAFQTNDKAAVGARFTTVMPASYQACETTKVKMCLKR